MACRATTPSFYVCFILLLFLLFSSSIRDYVGQTITSLSWRNEQLRFSGNFAKSAIRSNVEAHTADTAADHTIHIIEAPAAGSVNAALRARYEQNLGRLGGQGLWHI